MLKLTANRRRLIWAAVITAAVWMFGPFADSFTTHESVTISGESAPLSVIGSELMVGGLAVLATYAMVFVVLWALAVLRDLQKSRQRVD